MRVWMCLCALRSICRLELMPPWVAEQPSDKSHVPTMLAAAMERVGSSPSGHDPATVMVRIRHTHWDMHAHTHTHCSGTQTQAHRHHTSSQHRCSGFHTCHLVHLPKHGLVAAGLQAEPQTHRVSKTMFGEVCYMAGLRPSCGGFCLSTTPVVI